MGILRKIWTSSLGTEDADPKIYGLTIQECSRFVGMTYEQMHKLSPKFRYYVRTRRDVGCGLSKWFLTARERDRYFRACAVHDFWYEEVNKAAAKLAGITGLEIDLYFVRDADNIRADLVRDFPKWAWFYKHQGSLYKFLVLKVGKKLW